MASNWCINNPYSLAVTALTVGGVAETAATVTWTLTTNAGALLGSGTLTHTSGGTYTGTAAASLTSSLPARTIIILTYTAVKNSATVYKSVEKFMTSVRTFDE